MAAAAMSGKRASLWDEEIEHLFVVGPELPESARLIVCDVLESLLAGGELDARSSQAVRALHRELSAPYGLDRAPPCSPPNESPCLPVETKSAALFGQPLVTSPA